MDPPVRSLRRLFARKRAPTYTVSGEAIGALGKARATPTGAGTTSAADGLCVRVPSSPRRRGDDLRAASIALSSYELPLRARRRQRDRRRRNDGAGATPAGAGTTSTRPSPGSSTASYPRGRGDDYSGSAGGARRRELPPRGAGTTHTFPPARAVSRSYPRRRGDDPVPHPLTVENLELPPRARGRPGHAGQAEPPEGATSAGAGTTCSSGPSRPYTWSYPRGRGDDTMNPGGSSPTTELPPRARGQLGQLRLDGGRGRATPAGAGTTRPAPSGWWTWASYPRGRGDDTAEGTVTTTRTELPPRARGRGRRGRGACGPSGAGATPAGAGTTRRCCTSTCRSTSYPRELGDWASYPRGRGDDIWWARWEKTTVELPPRARGRAARRKGATPAGAGTTLCCRARSGTSGSYPRGRADDSANPGTRIGPGELPPRARGRHLLRAGLRLGGRATPAGAGTTSSPRGREAWCRSYPRGRGDDPSGIAVADDDTELPPRARGRRRSPRAGAGLGGATPAGAGTTPAAWWASSIAESYPRGRGDDSRLTGAVRLNDELPPRARGRLHGDKRVERLSRATPASAGTTSRT